MTTKTTKPLTLTQIVPGRRVRQIDSSERVVWTIKSHEHDDVWAVELRGGGVICVSTYWLTNYWTAA